MASQKQEREFCNEMAPAEDVTLLDKAIMWIKGNLTPEDVFDTRELEDWAEDWAKDNGWKQGE